jgi:hypothetical protein
MQPIQCGDEIAKGQAIRMVNCYESNFEANQNPQKTKSKTADGKIIMGDKDCYDRYSAYKGSLCKELPAVMDSYTYNDNRYTLLDAFKRKNETQLHVRALKNEVPTTNDWFVGVM